jgi:hypothetical protein
MTGGLPPAHTIDIPARIFTGTARLYYNWTDIAIPIATNKTHHSQMIVEARFVRQATNNE